jgi:shikimate kinase
MNFKKICESFAKEIDFYYLNTEELIDYSLFDKKKMADICGVGYMERQEVNIIKSVNDYENTVISMTYETFSKNISNINKKNKVIYLNVTKKQLEEEFNKLKEQTESQKTVSAKKSSILSNLGISLIVFEERDKFLKKNCNIEVKCDIYNIKETVSSIYASINK